MTAPTPVPSPEEEGDSPLVPRIGSGDSIAMVEITSHKDLEIWLEGKPVEFAQVIAARAALRALPYSLLRKELIDVKINHANIVFRDAIGVVTKFINIVHNEEAHQSVARKFLVNAAHELHDIPVGTTFRPEVAALTSLRAVNAAIQLPAAVVRDYTAMVYSACVAFDDQTDAWRAVSADAEWLNNRATRSATHRFDTSELWHGEQPSNLALMMSSIQNRLLALDPTYQVWIDWYNRRIKGEDAAFDIPGDINRTEDKGILIKLADATDEEFWGKGAEYVNSTLQSWIDEARERVALPDFEIFSARISAGAVADFGTNEAINCRADLERKIAALNDELSGLEPAPAPIGHNRPPLDLDGADIEDILVIVQEIRTESTSLGDEIKVPQPDLQATVAKFSRLRAIGAWLAKKADMFVDEAVKKAGAAFGGGVAIFFAAQLPQIKTLLFSVLKSANEWLQAVLPTI